MTRSSRRSALHLLAGTAGLVGLSACRPNFDLFKTSPVQPTQVAVWCAGYTVSSPPVVAFIDGLTKLGYTVGGTIDIIWRLIDSRDRPTDEVAQELIGMQPAAIVVAGTPQIVALAKRTSTIPLISVLPHRSLVSLGLAKSLAHPDGNVTGTEGKDDYYAKMVELLKTMIPSLTRVAYLRNPTTPGTDGPRAIAEAAAGQLGVDFVELQARNLDEVRAGFEMAHAAHAGGMVVATDSAFASTDDPGNLYPASNPLMALPIRHRIPVIYSGGDEYVVSGGLIGFGVDIGASYARAANYVDKILHGAAPADLPIEQIDIFDVSVNLSTARAIGITFPDEVLTQANQVFQ